MEPWLAEMKNGFEKVDIIPQAPFVRFKKGNSSMEIMESPELSAPSSGNDLMSAMRLRGESVRNDSFWEIACNLWHENNMHTVEIQKGA